MNDRTLTITARGLLSSFSTVDATAPKPLTAAYDRLTRTAAAWDALDVPRADAIAPAVLAALEADGDPTTDPAVARALTGAALTARPGLRDELAGIVATDLITAARDHVDAIVDAWRAPFDRAAADLTAARDELDAIDLTDTDAVVRRGPAATGAWQKATAAVSTVEAIATGWGHLYRLLNGRFVAKEGRVHVTYDLTPEEATRRNQARDTLDPWRAVCEGVPLRLATPAEVDALTAATRRHRADAATDQPRRLPAAYAAT